MNVIEDERNRVDRENLTRETVKVTRDLLEILENIRRGYSIAQLSSYVICRLQVLRAL